MKRWIARAAALYPRRWRGEYGDEFAALLEDVKPNGRVFADVLGGAIRMQMTMGGNWLKLVAATAVLGAIVAVGASFTVAPRYVSQAVLSVTPQVDPVRPSSPEALRQRAASRVAQMQQEIFSRTSLAAIITDPQLDLYRAERQHMPLEDVIETMRRRDIRVNILELGAQPVVFSISFSYPDQVKAQAVTRRLMARFDEVNVRIDRDQENFYRSFWKDMAVAHAVPSPPPGPTGEALDVLAAASLPQRPAGPNRIVFLMWGIGTGLMLGLLAAIAIRWPRSSRQIGGFALTGFVLAAAVSYLIPNRYTSTAVLRITPAEIMEDPRAPLPNATSAAEFLREIKPKVLSFQSLARMIEDPRTNLYPGERARRPMEEVVANMLANDLRIEPLNRGTFSAFSISFSYADPHKAQIVVQTMITKIFEEYLVDQRAKAAQMSDTRKQIMQRKAGEWLNVLDSPTLPEKPNGPNRLMIALLGLGIGLVIGGVTNYLRRPRMPVLQPA